MVWEKRQDFNSLQENVLKYQLFFWKLVKNVRNLNTPPVPTGHGCWGKFEIKFNQNQLN